MSTVIGVFAGAAAAGRVLGLSREQMANALSIASMQSGGTMEVVYGIGGDLRGIYAGFSAKAAVVSALLAEKGISGAKSEFEGKAGFFNTYFAGNSGNAHSSPPCLRRPIGLPRCNKSPETSSHLTMPPNCCASWRDEAAVDHAVLLSKNSG